MCFTRAIVHNSVATDVYLGLVPFSSLTFDPPAPAPLQHKKRISLKRCLKPQQILLTVATGRLIDPN